METGIIFRLLNGRTGTHSHRYWRTHWSCPPLLLLGVLFLSGCAIDTAIDSRGLSGLQGTPVLAGTQSRPTVSWVKQLDEIQQPPVETAVAPGDALADLIALIDHRPLLVQSVVARLSAKITGRNGKTQSADGVYMGDAHGNMRLKLTGMFGILGLDLALRDDDFKIWMPLRKLGVIGTRREALNGESTELLLLATLGLSHNLFFPRAWTDNAAERRAADEGGKLAVRVYEKSGRSLECARRFVIDTAGQSVASQEVFTTAGFAIGRLEYLHFCPIRDLTAPGESTGDLRDLPVASAVRLVQEGGMTLEIEVKSISVNKALPADAFEFQIKSNDPVHTLREMLTAGTSFIEP